MTSKDTNPKDAIGTAKWRQFMTVPRQVLWEVGVGMLEGALKYGRHNYRGAGVRASVYLDAAYGHLDQFTEGEDIDKDSGLSHVTKAIASLVVLRDAMMNDFWTDDRPPMIKDLEGTRQRLQDLVQENFERYADKSPHHYTQVEDGAPYRGGDARVMSPEELARRIEMPPGAAVVNDMLAGAFNDVFSDLFGPADERVDVSITADEMRVLGDMLRSGEMSKRIAEFEEPQCACCAPDDDEFEMTGVDDDDELLSALIAMLASGRGMTGDYQRVGDVSIMKFTVDPETGDVQTQDFDLSDFASGGVIKQGGGLVGEAGPEAVMPPRDETIWSMAFAHIPPLQRDWVLPSKMIVGKAYRVHSRHDGTPVENGGVWKIVHHDGVEAYGIKPHWPDTSKGVKLAASTRFREVNLFPQASLTREGAWGARDVDFQDEDILQAAAQMSPTEAIELACRLTGLPREAIVRIEDGDGNVLYRE